MIYSVRHILLLGISAFAFSQAVAQTSPPTSFVDPRIGTNPNPFTKIGYAFDTGNVFPGAVCPRGMLAWSPDTNHCRNIAGGYWYPDNKIEDFSLTHFSGRGVPCLRDIAFTPLIQPVQASPGTAWESYSSSFSHENETASPGYYRVKFDNGIQTELTATPRSGMARFTFPPNSSATLLIRATGSITVSSNEVSGHSKKLHFFARFSSPIATVKTWDGDKISSATTATDGAILTFDTSKNNMVSVQVGISYTSDENAKDNLTQENKGEDFATVQSKAVEMWNRELKRVEIEGGTDDEKKVFYTALYHCFMHPNILDDANGQYLGMDSKIHSVEAGHHQYQNIPAWDEHRSHSPLMAVLANHDSGDVMQSLVNYAQQDAAARSKGGGMPRWEQVNFNSGGMVGDGDDSIIASSYAFGVTSFDTKAAWDSMEKGATEPGLTSDSRQVREGLADYKQLGYVPERASVTLEYCSDDFALSQFAKSLGFQDKSDTYLKRAQDWRNLFDSTTGYIRPRSKDGKWPASFSPSSDKGFVEGTAAQYLWLVNFNLRGLSEKLGGNDQTIKRLDHFFTKTNDGLRSEYAYMGNEPCEEVPWVYDALSVPSRTQEVVRRIQNELFTTQPGGIPGNDDAGSLSSWYVFSALGIYPEIPGAAGFFVGSPLFPKATIHLDNGNTIQIIAPNASASHPFVTGLKLNGVAYESPWIPWSKLSDGGILEFDLSDKASQWGEKPENAPPSFDVNH